MAIFHLTHLADPFKQENYRFQVPLVCSWTAQTWQTIIRHLLGPCWMREDFRTMTGEETQLERLRAHSSWKKMRVEAGTKSQRVTIPGEVACMARTEQSLSLLIQVICMQKRNFGKDVVSSWKWQQL